MFTSEANLFFSASNNVSNAKTLINSCKVQINNLQIESSHYTNCKNNITGCDIDSLMTLIEETKESLVKLDETFATEYMACVQEFLSGMDTSNMTEEELMQYNIQWQNAYIDYNYNVLYMLEKLEEAGVLTPELEAEIEEQYGTNLAFQREFIARYEFHDQMTILDPTSQEYIDLYKELAEYDRRLINLNPTLTNEQKESSLANFEIEYSETISALTQAREDKLKNEQLEQELQELYESKESNSGFFHPFVENSIDEAILDKKIEIGEFNPDSPYAATADEIEYKNMNGCERFFTNAETFCVSTFTGLYSVTETIEDGVVMIGAKAGVCDQNWAAAYVSEDQSALLYDGIVMSTDMNEHSAYGTWHTAGDTFGTTLGYIGMSYLPGGAYVTGAVGGLSAMGSSSERALQSGATFDEAFQTGAISGVTGCISGAVLGKFNKFAMGNTTTVAQIGRNILIGGGISTVEPIVNSIAEYNIYAKEMVDENGEKVYDDILDYYVDGGGLANTGFAFAAGGFSSGMSSFKGYKAVQDVYGSNAFKSQKDGYQWFEDNCTNVKSLEEALPEQYQFIKKTYGYKGSYLEFLSEYASGNFSKPINFDQAVTDAQKYGATTILDGDGLSNVAKYESLGRGSIEGKQGASFATPNNSQSALEARLTTQGAGDPNFDFSIEERAAKGINTASAQNGFYKVEYTPEFFADNPNANVFYNSGPNNINGASSAAMPGGATYDLHSNGNGVTEICIGDIGINASAKDAIIEYVMSGTGGTLDLGSYDSNLTGIRIVSYGG